MKLPLVPAWWIPPEVMGLVELHQGASVQDPGPQTVHCVALRTQALVRAKGLEELSEPPGGARHLVVRLLSTHRTVEAMAVTAFRNRFDR